MPRIRITEKSPIKVELLDDNGDLLRQLDQVGHPGGTIDWKKTANSSKSIDGDTGLEITFRFKN